MFITPQELCKEFGVQINGIIHVGACTAEEFPLYKEIEVKNIIWIEANIHLAYNLSKKLKNISGHSVYCFAATDVSDQLVTLNITNNLQSSSILKLKKHKKYYPNIKVQLVASLSWFRTYLHLCLNRLFSTKPQ